MRDISRNNVRKRDDTWQRTEFSSKSTFHFLFFSLSQNSTATRMIHSLDLLFSRLFLIRFRRSSYIIIVSLQYYSHNSNRRHQQSKQTISTLSSRSASETQRQQEIKARKKSRWIQGFWRRRLCRRWNVVWSCLRRLHLSPDKSTAVQGNRKLPSEDSLPIRLEPFALCIRVPHASPLPTPWIWPILLLVVTVSLVCLI